MKKFLPFKEILIFSALLSMIFLPAVLMANPKAYGALSDCINWANLPDKDCDGLADVWEKPNAMGFKQYVKNVNGVNIVVKLDKRVDWQHRDILVEIDSMGHHVPTTTAIDLAKTKFNTFGLLNPDGSTGVKIWYTRDDNTIPHPPNLCIDAFTDTNGNPDDDFDTIKEQWMGNNTERGGSPNSNFYQAKRDIYHYVLFAHTICGAEIISGRGETNGNDLVVTLGATGWGNVKQGHDTGSEDYKGATFMHEMGHNLGLKHGGDEDLNCKPNYISAMNYVFQFPTYVPSRVLDYSRSLINPPLDETNLNENVGIGTSSPSGLPTTVGHTSQSLSHPGISHKRDALADNSAINYNWYEGSNNNNQIGVQSSLINFHFSGCNLDNLRTLYGFNDVHHNILNFWGTEAGFSQNATGLPIDTSDAESPIVPIALASGLNNSSISKSNQSAIQNKSEADILKDETLPPCDLSIPGCQDFPCDIQNDPYCKDRIDLRHNFSNTNFTFVDYGNRTELPPELTVTDVLNAISSKVQDINGHIQSLDENNFTQGTNVPKLKQDLQDSLIDAPDSIHSKIQSGESEIPLAKSLKLRGLSQQKILDPEKTEVLKLVDGLITALEKKPDKPTD